MTDDDLEVKSDYTIDTTTVQKEEEQKDDSEVEMDLQYYLPSKPRRVTIRARIIHDKD